MKIKTCNKCKGFMSEEMVTCRKCGESLKNIKIGIKDKLKQLISKFVKLNI